MKIITYNVNGIRAAMKKGLVDWVKTENPDIFCLQEVKALPEQVDLEEFTQLGYTYYWFPAEKKGYSGVATFTKVPPVSSQYGMGIEKYDVEGRSVELQFDDFTLINTYFPSGTTGDIRQDFKYEFLDDYFEYIAEKKKTHNKLVLCGDVNICHKSIDIHNPVSNKNSSGFLPKEREWVSKFLESGFVDSFRHFNPAPHHYTWWSYRAGARKKNLGWRIDYFFVSQELTPQLSNCTILNEAVHSDHCPVALEMH
ncbi:exodeoxyribonuclease III [Rapidithrix thailandica]|uniref:Exodeoxyribonuclease III n=1 Tax=Rapidithrix thailandica TaxID=413964 RepID=A0AAW9S1G8_9BACT